MGGVAVMGYLEAGRVLVGIVGLSEKARGVLFAISGVQKLAERLSISVQGLLEKVGGVMELAGSYGGF